MDHQELNSCPFCGNIPEMSLRVFDTATSKTYGFECCVEMETGTTDPAEAIAMWNTQAPMRIVGKVENLPPVGPGSVLADMLASARDSGTELQTVFRQDALKPIVYAPYGYVINEFGDSVPAENAEEAARGVRRRAEEATGEAAAQTSAPAEDEGDIFNIKDPDLHMLLNLSADMAMGNANQDTAMLWMDYLKRVEARLGPAKQEQAAQNYPDHELTDTERMVRTLQSEPTPEAMAFYNSLKPGAPSDKNS